MMRSMSLRSISRGMSRWRRSRIAVGATVGSQFIAAEVARRPRCEIWHMIAAPWPWMRDEKACRSGMMASLDMSIWPPPQLESRATIEEPPNMVSAMPPLAFSSW